MTNKPTSATQREILSGNSTVPYNRANDIPTKDNEGIKELNIGLKDLDYTIKYYFDNVIRPSFDDFGSKRNVPVMYGSPERWKNMQEGGYFRDREGKILAPLIAYKRTGLTKNRALGSKVDANHPQVYYSQQVKYTQNNRYDQFSRLTNQTPSRTYVNTVMADYVDVTYDVIIWTDFIEQMNSIVESVLYSEGSFWGEDERFKFRAKIDSFTNTTDNLQDSERVVRTTFTITLFGYIVPDVIVKQLSDKLSDITYSPREIVTETVIPSTTSTGVLRALSVSTDSAVFELMLPTANVSRMDFNVSINGQATPVGAIKNVSQTAHNTTTLYFDVAELGYTLTPRDVVTVSGKFV